MGKTGTGTVWLDPEMVSSYEYYQFWINTEDADVERFLAIYTFLPMEEVRELGRLEGADLRRAKEVLAFEATKITHGEEAAVEARATSRALFGGAGADREGVPTSSVSAADLESGVPVAVLFADAGVTTSRGEARRLIQQGGAYVNDRRVESVEQVITIADLSDGALLLRAGKKKYHRVVVKEG
jgi:tyrosyl-tRNA synthetase